MTSATVAARTPAPIHAQAQQRWSAHVAPVGHFTVLRALPMRRVHSVGPFVFLDHFGPAQASPETLPAHPHAGIEVMTYLLEGANEHRDSMGHRGVVEAGGAQWMRAGRGILHAETNLPDRHPRIHGLQIWARLPIAQQYAEPAYRAIASTDVPQWTQTVGTAPAAELRLLAGHYHERIGPMPLCAPSLLLHVRLAAAAQVELTLRPDFEYGVYGIAGAAQWGLPSGTQVDTDVQAGVNADVQADAAHTQAIGRGDFALLQGQASQQSEQILLALHNPSAEPCDVLLMGGAAVEGELHFGGPFVLDSQAALQQAMQDYAAGKMGTLDGVPF